MPLTFGPDPRLEYSPVTRTLVLANVGVFLLGLAGDLLGVPGAGTQSLLGLFGLFPARVVGEGMLWTPFTYMFLHANLVHLFVNMMGLYLLGPDLEQAFGKRNYLLLYLLSGLLGGLGFVGISYLLLGQATPCVGASGAIMGLLGAIVAIYPRRIYVLLPLMIPMRATVLAVLMLSSHLFFILTPYGGRVAYDVHLLGGLTGYLISGGLALTHRLRWRGAIPAPEVPYACVELESLVHKLARTESQALSGEEWSRYRVLKDALRYEDVPSLAEVRAMRR